MRNHSLLTLTLCPIVVALVLASTAFGQQPAFKVLAFYSTVVENDHIHFALHALTFFRDLAAKNGFAFESTKDWKKLNEANLKDYRVVVWINDFPHTEEQRAAFQSYMSNGGGWLGFHVAAYNDRFTNWPWYVDFLGGGVFHANNWPPLPAKVTIDDHSHPVTKGLPADFISPVNEWYRWEPSPRLNKDVRVLATLDASNYPLGIKDVLRSGDLPVVWTNTKYRMVYMNMGHGDQIFDESIQNTMISNALLWLAGTPPSSR